MQKQSRSITTPKPDEMKATMSQIPGRTEITVTVAWINGTLLWDGTDGYSGNNDWYRVSTVRPG